MNHELRKGFTLIELMVVMAILGIILAIGVGAFTSTQKKSRDATRKANLKAIATALEFYFNDRSTYPRDDGVGGIKGCGQDGMNLCTPNSIFQDSNGTVYMERLPADPSPSQRYYYRSIATNQYQLYTHLENTQDTSIITTTYNCANGSGTILCNYGVSSSNIKP